MVVNKKIIFLAILFVGLLTISTPSAADNSTDDMINSDSDTLDLTASDGALSATQQYSLSATPGNYKELSDLIEKTKKNGILKLNKDYKYDESFTSNGITISKPITIDGNGHTIDGNDLARAFNVTANQVALKNIKFKNCFNGNDDGAYGGAVYWHGGDGLLAGYQFSNSRAVALNGTSYGGAVYWRGYDGKIANCDFNDCYSRQNTSSNPDNYVCGGAVYWWVTDGAIENSRFTNCSVNAYATSEGGAVYWLDYNDVLKNCQFTNCLATSNCTANGAAVYWDGESGLIENCRFSGNSKEKENGVVYISGDDMTVESSYFFDNARNDLYWTGQSAHVHNSVLYKLTDCDPIYSKTYNVYANYNWWGNTNSDYNKKLHTPSRVSFDRWFYLTVSTDKDSLLVGETAKINIKLNNLYSNGKTAKYKDCKLPYVTFTVTGKGFTKHINVSKGSGAYKFVAKSSARDPVTVQFDKHVKSFKYITLKVTKKLKSKSKKKIVNLIVKDGSGPIKKVKVTLKVKGKYFKGKTNSKGLVKFDMSKKLKKARKYKASIKIKKSKLCNKVYKKVKIVVKK